VKRNLMILRTAFLIALVVGAGGLFHVYAMTPIVRDVHIVAGIIVFAVALWLATSVKKPLAWVAVVVLFVFGLWPLVFRVTAPWIWLHIAAMVIAVGLLERVFRQAQPQKLP
jgi:hypothetical protein